MKLVWSVAISIIKIADLNAYQTTNAILCLLMLQKKFRTIVLEAFILRYELKGMPGYVPKFLGWFWVHAHNFTHVRPRSKKGPKSKI